MSIFNRRAEPAPYYTCPKHGFIRAATETHAVYFPNAPTRIYCIHCMADMFEASGVENIASTREPPKPEPR